MPRIGVIGCGAWATVAAKILSENNHPTTIWCHRDAYADAINTKRINTLALPGIALPENLTAVTDRNSLRHCDYWVICVPSKVMVDLSEFQSVYDSQPIISLTKGLSPDPACLLVSQYLRKIFQTAPAVLSGPNLASELALQLPAASVAACENPQTAADFQTMFSNAYFR
ncbi:glycerol-3-phosphate dehydrogenase, partial [bacterium]|nr:glycerol-3-phosphate dehydrogenase [bacterium]